MEQARIKQAAEYINILGKFCGKRDVEFLTSRNLQEKYGIDRADVMVLFGGSILCGGDVLARAMQEHVAKHYIIVGGEGHTTETLREKVRENCPSVPTEGLSEAEIFNKYLNTVYGLQADDLETRSTNCGNNITYLLDLLRRRKIDFRTVILCQDATMQRRMEAGFRKYAGGETIIINYAAYEASVTVRDGRLAYTEEIYGMWETDRYVNLLMGEIPRLTDDAEGYGPRGKNFIAHVEIPAEVQEAFEALKKVYGKEIRKADPLYASVIT